MTAFAQKESTLVSGTWVSDDGLTLKAQTFYGIIKLNIVETKDTYLQSFIKM
ncbi:MAG: hypothetical protein RSE07_02540 [Oscillospiraceae bacterium]